MTLGVTGIFEGSHEDVSVIQRDDERQKRGVDEGAWMGEMNIWDK